MLESIYIGLTGLTGYSKNLSVIGNNVSNLNTVGFKTSQLLFANLYYRTQFGDNASTGGQQPLELGTGLGTAGTTLVFKQGELRATGNDQDVAIDGNGFFVLRRDGQTFYSRAGQFSFDAEGYLVAAADTRVAALVGNTLQDINIKGDRTNSGKPTARVEFLGTLNNNVSPTAPFTVAGITVYDSLGQPRIGTVSFTNNVAVTPGSWLVAVKDQAGNSVASGEIRFNGDGTPAAGFNSLSFDLNPEGAAASTVNLFFGDPGTASGTRSLSASSSDVRVGTQDGFGVGALVKASFDANGQLVVSYSNGQTAKFDKLALASFNHLQGLSPLEGNLFSAGLDEAPTLGTASQGPFGKIAGSQVELGNVDLAQEFSDLIVTQRGYQAASQVLSTANEMIQQLYDIKARR